ncbi:MAG: AAA-like domain-containing protein [Myxococcales bacterium]|jgi:hypothetical protein|nr:AAA-like domain-containing protein [Myxococcales bacterium]
MAQQSESETRDWPEIFRMASDLKVETKGRALFFALGHAIEALKEKKVWLPSKKPSDALNYLSEFTAIPNNLKVREALHLRNIYAHPEEASSISKLPHQQVLEATKVLKEFAEWLHTVQINPTNATSNTTARESEVAAGHAVGLPPPPSISYVPAFYVNRRIEERRALSCLAHPGNAITIQGPALSGKKTLVAYIVEKMSKQKGIRIIRINGAAPEPICEFTSQLASSSEGIKEDKSAKQSVTSEWIEKTVTLLKSQTLSRNQIALVVIENADQLYSKEPVFVETLKSWRGMMEEPWTRMRFLYTVSLDKSSWKLCEALYTEHCISLENFLREEVEQLSRLHGFNNADDEVSAIWSLAEGHPYITRLCLYESFIQGLKPSEIIYDVSIFERHLESLQRSINAFRISNFDEFQDEITDLRQMEFSPTLPFSLMLYRLGILKERNGKFYPRCLLYIDFLRRIMDETVYTVEIIELSESGVTSRGRHFIPENAKLVLTGFDFLYASPLNSNLTLADIRIEIYIRSDLMCIKKLNRHDIDIRTDELKLSHNRERSFYDEAIDLVVDAVWKFKIVWRKGYWPEGFSLDLHQYKTGWNSDE